MRVAHFQSQHNSILFSEIIPIAEQILEERTVPLVSICCMVYNHDKYICNCLDGFLMQKTNFPIEILVHEDASTDNTATILKEYELKYPKLFRCVYQIVNQFKIQNTLTNILFPMAKGKYIAFCEGDDYWTDPLKLQKQVDFLEQNEDCAGCFHETQQIYQNGDLGIIYGKDAPDIMYAEDTFATTSPFHTSSFVFRRLENGVPDWFMRIVSGDMALFSVVSANGFLKKIPEIMSVYRKLDSGITNQSFILDYYNLQRIELMSYLNEFHNFKYNTKAQQVISFHRKRIISELKEKGDEKPKLNFDNFHSYLINLYIYQNFIENINNLKGNFLNIGCGDVLYKHTLFAKTNVEKYLSIDIENPVGLGHKKSNVKFENHKIDLPNNYIDCAFITLFNDSIQNFNTFLVELKRILKHNAFILFLMPKIFPKYELNNDENERHLNFLKETLNLYKFNNINFKSIGGWNNSFAQVISMWLSNCQMSETSRENYKKIFFPFIESLVDVNRLYENQIENQLICANIITAFNNQE